MLANPAILDVVELPRWLEAARDRDETIALVKSAGAKVSSECVQPDTPARLRLRPIEQLLADAAALETYANVQLRDRIDGCGDEAHQFIVHEREADLIALQDLGQKGVSLFRKRMRIDDPDPGFEARPPHRHELIDAASIVFDQRRGGS